MIPSPRCRPHSPHPADVLRGHASYSDYKTSISSGTLPSTTISLIPPPPFTPKSTPTTTKNDTPTLTRRDSTPNFSISDNLKATEHAEELRQLIDAMKIEFSRLRNAKMQTEKTVIQLQNDLALQKKQFDKRHALLHAENHHLKDAVNASDVKLDMASKKILQLENEIRLLKEQKIKRRLKKKEKTSGIA